MDCGRIEPLLIDFHFGYVGHGEAPHPGYEVVAAHLRGCASCLSTYLDLKRDVDYGAASPARLPEPRRKSLRDAVAAEFRPSLLHRATGWLAAPSPRYQLAAALGIVLLIGGAAIGLRGTTPAPGLARSGARSVTGIDPADATGVAPPPALLTQSQYEAAWPHRLRTIDTARERPASLTFY